MDEEFEDPEIYHMSFGASPSSHAPGVVCNNISSGIDRGQFVGVKYISDPLVTEKVVDPVVIRALSFV